eukprot:c13460_g1_i1 orf=79-1491(+)
MQTWPCSASACPSTTRRASLRSLVRCLCTCTQENPPPPQNPNLFKQNQHPSEFQLIQAFASLLQNTKSFSSGSIAHFLIFHAGYSGTRFLSNLLIDLYGKCGALRDALYIFHSLHRKNVFTWNIVFSALVQHGQSLHALQLFNQMLLEGLTPDKFTYSTIIDACALMDTLSEGIIIHCMLAHNRCESHVVVATALINMYSKHSRLEPARHVFNQISVHDTVSWSAMIEAYAKHGYEKMSVHLFQQMQKESVKPDPVALIAVLGACATFSTLAWGKIFHSTTIESGLETDLLVGNALVNMYAKCGNLEDGLRVFERMGLRDVISWTAMMSTYNQAGLVQEALQLFVAMQADGVRPNEITFVNVLSACSHEGMVEEGLLYFFFMCSNDFISLTSQHYGCLIDLFGRAGRLEEAELFLSSTDIRHSAVIWQALLGACKAHNDVERGKRVAELIIQLDPFVSAPYVALSDFLTA